MFERTGSNREYTAEEHEASLKRFAKSWGAEGSGYTAARHEMFQASALGSELRAAGSDDEDEDIKSIFAFLDQIDRLADFLA